MGWQKQIVHQHNSADVSNRRCFINASHFSPSNSLETWLEEDISSSHTCQCGLSYDFTDKTASIPSPGRICISFCLQICTLMCEFPPCAGSQSVLGHARSILTLWVHVPVLCRPWLYLLFDKVVELALRVAFAQIFLSRGLTLWSF